MLDPQADVFLDMMSDGFVWDDERVTGLDLTAEQMGCLRAILRYRTGLIVGIPDARFEKLWNLLRARCPEWIGFTPSRCNFSQELADRYKQEKKRSERRSVA